jgi:hypothetical protein
MWTSIFNAVSSGCAPSPATVSKRLKPVNPFPVMLMSPSTASCAVGATMSHVDRSIDAAALVSP